MESLFEKEKSNDKKRIFFFVVVIFLIVASLLYVGISYYKKRVERERVLKEKEKIEKEIIRLQTEKKKSEEEGLKKQEALMQTHATEDLQIEGVEIVTKENTKTLKNISGNFEIEYPKEFILARSFNSAQLNFFIPDKDGYLSCPGISEIQFDFSISILKNPDKKPLDTWIKENVQVPNVEGDSFFLDMGTKKIGDLEWHIVELYVRKEFDVPVREYLLQKDDTILVFSITNWDERGLRDFCPHKQSINDLEKLLLTFKFI